MDKRLVASRNKLIYAFWMIVYIINQMLLAFTTRVFVVRTYRIE